MIKRYFTKDIEQGHCSESEEMFAWKAVDICLKDQKDNPIFEQKNCFFPEHFSQTACDIIASKYFYRGENESSLSEVVHRMACFWGDALLDEEILTEEERSIFIDEIKYIIYNQMWAPNSPQWFNTGVVKSYFNAKNDEGLFYYDEHKNKVLPASKDSFRTQASACYILDIEDKLIGKSSITDHYVTETKLFKAGSGCGTNFSSLRAAGEALSSGGTSSGLMSYLKGLDVNAGTIKSGGTTRRAAKMVIVDVDHPEIENFIDWKVKEEEKAKALIAAGYDGSIGGEAYSTVSGQNSNNSVRVDDEFMDSVEEDLNWDLFGRIDGSVNKKVKASKLFEKIATAAWSCGDPGIQFDNTINRWNTCSNSGRINASNPCGEFVFLDNTACNLSSINLEKFIKEDKFDVDSFFQVVRLAQLAMEASIHWGEYPTEEIAENSYKFRPTGLGVAGLAGFLEALNLSYDSAEARQWASTICSFMTAASYEISGEIAEKVGPFIEYEKNKIPMSDVLCEHYKEIDTAFCVSDNLNLELLVEFTLEKWEDALSYINTGYRNAQVTCIAPTGTISLAMDASSTGIEPYYSRRVYKKLADGSSIEQEQDAIKTAEEISPEDHVQMIAAIQPHISGAISKTVNLPNQATVEDVKSVYKLAYDLGCKSITIYRDGSKGTQVLETKEQEQSKSLSKKVINVKDFYFGNEKELKRSKPEGIRDSRTHAAKIGDIELYITVGFYPNGDMAEIFVSTDRDGTVIKGLLASLSKTISHLLQYGINPDDISRILRGQKYEPSGIVDRHPYIKFADSISDLISKVIDIECGNYSRCQVKPEESRKEKKEYIHPPNSETDDILRKIDKEDSIKIYGETCSICGSSNLVQTGVCKVCLDCGSTTGCS